MKENVLAEKKIAAGQAFCCVTRVQKVSPACFSLNDAAAMALLTLISEVDDTLR